MNSTVLIKTFNPPSIKEDDILRYAGCKNADGETQALLNSCLKETENKFTYKVCYRFLPVKIMGDLCDFELFSVKSENLSLNLKDCKQVVLFAATIGIEADRLISKYSRISPTRAVMLQAIGTERIEGLCDLFCDEILKEISLKAKPRFSPGYGDLPLEAQKQIFRFLECSKHIGLTLNDSLTMSPTKSVTAFLGLY